MNLQKKKLSIAILSIIFGGTTLSTYAEIQTNDETINANGHGADVVLNNTNTTGSTADWEICTGNSCNGVINALPSTNGFKITNQQSTAIGIESGAGNGVTPLLYLDSNDKLGINVANPTHTVHLKSTYPAIKFEDTSLNAQSAILAQNGQLFFMTNQAGYGALQIETNGGLPQYNQLHLDSTGNVSVGGVNNPVADFQVGGSGNLMLDNGAEDWTFYTNSANLYIRNGNNTIHGSQPIIFENQTPNYTFVTKNNGNIGMGTYSPSAALHMRKNNAKILLQETSPTNTSRVMLEVENNGAPAIRLTNSSTSRSWDFSQTNGGNFMISKAGSGNIEFQVTNTGRVLMGTGANMNFDLRDNGDLYIPNGNIFVGGTQLSVPDYVFENDYKLMSLDALETFIKTEKHLPNVASESDIKKAKLLNISQSQMSHLEKIEELTLYTIQQHKQIKALQSKNSDFEQRLSEQTMALQSENSALKERLASLEKLVTNLASSGSPLGSNNQKVAMTMQK